MPVAPLKGWSLNHYVKITCFYKIFVFGNMVIKTRPTSVSGYSFSNVGYMQKKLMKGNFSTNEILVSGNRIVNSHDTGG